MVSQSVYRRFGVAQKRLGQGKRLIVDRCPTFLAVEAVQAMSVAKIRSLPPGAHEVRFEEVFGLVPRNAPGSADPTAPGVAISDFTAEGPQSAFEDFNPAMADCHAAARGRTSALMRSAEASSAAARSYFACRFFHIFPYAKQSRYWSLNRMLYCPFRSPLGDSIRNPGRSRSPHPPLTLSDLFGGRGW